MLLSACLNVLGNALNRVVSLTSGSDGADAIVNERDAPRASECGCGSV
jgi:hypothetical protein